jgi:hypothetical protein
MIDFGPGHARAVHQLLLDFILGNARAGVEPGRR